MIHRWPGFLADVWFGSSPTPLSPPLLSKSSTVDTQEAWHLLTGEGGGREAESHDCKKAWSSINHSILSAQGQGAVQIKNEWKAVFYFPASGQYVCVSVKRARQKSVILHKLSVLNIAVMLRIYQFELTDTFLSNQIFPVVEQGCFPPCLKSRTKEYEISCTFSNNCVMSL
jgi:hypothetical protein